MLAQTLACHPETLALHEPRPFLSTENFAAWQGTSSSERLRREIREKRDWLLETADQNTLQYIESSHFLAHLITHLHELYHPLFIYVYRDGRDFVRSGLTRNWYTSPSPKARLARILRRLTLQPFGNPVEDHQLTPPPEARTRFEKAAWLWNQVNRNIQAQLDSLSQPDVFRLRLEDFEADTLLNLLDFLEIDASTRTLDRMISVSYSRPNRTQKPFSIPSKSEWAEERLRTFMRFAGEQMRKLGYWEDGQSAE
jgi:hypothetical protein